jgi:hypothetical protein
MQRSFAGSAPGGDRTKRFLEAFVFASGCVAYCDVMIGGNSDGDGSERGQGQQGPIVSGFELNLATESRLDLVFNIDDDTANGYQSGWREIHGGDCGFRESDCRLNRQNCGQGS